MKRQPNSQRKLPNVPKHSSLFFPKINKIADGIAAINSLKARSKRSELLLKQIKPYNKQDSRSSSDGSRIMNRIASPNKKQLQPEIVVLTKNQDKKKYLHEPYHKQSLIGEQAIQKFYARYKQIDKAIARQTFFNEVNPLTRIVDLLQTHNFAPRRLDLIKLKGSEAILDLRTLGLGHGSLGPLVTELVQYMGKFESVDLSYNQIDRILSQTLIERLSKVQNINLSHNRVGKIACTKFAQLFLSSTTLITHLNLQDNNLLDNAGTYIVEHLLTYKQLKYLNLSKNFMGTKFAIKIRQVLLNDSVLDELYLSWNQFGQKSTQLIFEAIQSNQNLKVFDYSWNNISILNAQIVGKALKSNIFLVHVDLSFCQIPKKGTQIISKYLQNNHTIYGFHFQGNSGIVDHKGYLKITQKQHFEYPLPIVKGIIRRIDGVKPNPIFNTFKQDSLRDICWICHSWQQFIFKIDKKDYPDSNQCFVHLQHEQYQGIKLEFNSQENCYETARMCPIGMMNFFFTIAYKPSKKIHMVSSQFSIVQYGKIPLKQTIEKMNRYQLNYNIDPLDENYSANITNLPRSLEVKVNYRLPKQNLYRQMQKMKIKSINKKKIIRQQKLNMEYRNIQQNFAQDFIKDSNNRDDDQVYLRQCLEFDINNSKIAKVLKKQQDLNTFKKLMDSYYVDFKDVYYYLANGSSNNLGIYSIADYQFQKFLEQQKYITKRVTHAKIMVKLYSCLSAGDQQSQQKKNQPAKLFIRPQFLQFIIRLAIEKWCTFIPKPKLARLDSIDPDKVKDKEKDKQKEKEKQKDDEEQGGQDGKKSKLKLPLSLSEGLQRTLKSLSKFAARVRASNWRRKKFLTIQTYTVIKGYQTLLLQLFEKYTGIKARVGKPKKLHNLIVLDDFKAIFIDTEIKRTKQAMKQIQPCFLDSKRLEIEDGIIQYGLNYDEFLQCLARSSQLIWFPPIAAQNNKLWQFEPNRRFIPLFIKFEALIINIYRRMIDIQNTRMNKITQKGIFIQQMQVLPDKVQQLALRTSNNVAFKINTFSIQQQDQITFKILIELLKEKYQNAVIRRQEIVQEVVERQQYR